MLYVLHYLSKLGTFLIIYSLIMLILNYTLGFLPYIKKVTVYGWPLEFFVFSLIAFVLIARYIEISSPYADMMGK